MHNFFVLLRLIAISFFLIPPAFAQFAEQDSNNQTQQKLFQQAVTQFKQDVLSADAETQKQLGTKLQPFGITQPIPPITWDSNSTTTTTFSNERQSVPAKEETISSPSQNNSSTNTNTNTNTSGSSGFNMYQQ